MAIDVSSYQGKPDWEKVYGDGVRVALIKFGEYETVDGQALRNIEECRKHGIRLGLYYFAHPSRSPLGAARWFLRAADPYLKPGDLPPALDLELAEGHDWAYLNDWKATWLQAVDAHVGVKAIFYSYLSFWQRMELYPDRPVWGADLRAGFKPPTSWAIHQYSFTGKVNGISRAVDFDRVLWAPRAIR